MANLDAKQGFRVLIIGGGEQRPIVLQQDGRPQRLNVLQGIAALRWRMVCEMLRNLTIDPFNIPV